MRLFHFSDHDDIDVFVPRAPLRHPDAEPLVWAVDEAHEGMYLVPRNCPRISVWKLDSGPVAMRVLIDRRFEPDWRTGRLVRYELPSAGFEATDVPGVKVNRGTVRPLAIAILTDLPAEADKRGIRVEVVESLSKAALEFYDPSTRQFEAGWHVSMNRMTLLGDWYHD